MKIIGLLCWYEEDPAWLAECVASAARLCDHLVAVDGAYAEFPGALAKPASGTEQAEIINRTAAGAGIGCTIHAPRLPWWSGEVGKRDFMFRLAATFADPDDWYLVIDADEVLTSIPSDTRRRLAETSDNVAELMLWERESQAAVAELVDTRGDYLNADRRLFRALPDLGVEQAHYVYTATLNGHKAVMRGNQSLQHLEPAADFTDLRMEHRTHQRTQSRKRLKRDYYSLLPDLEHVEALT
ncbi:hypothetical protein [Fodinicola feengrottensis]|uniref:Glycosyltransferase n=1 Tax=Fodinicola feengrottensis TaxID=435914 RepID=A0ABN2IBI2_9ACTN|nr:hypothetical protein [Fodinicola feengrottensis]